ncbi:acyltransferase family protein [Pseudomonas frederiksbergensis]|uniref:Acyltransferase n=1 Tax=Pseudomonas frederiksbergensis TaxID=104087 RepID=A0A423KD51_9PSED|nr:acyltransferase family protein [Pseudomonas frederiksbergensis]RON50311.1 acyltransferase [Pseudomonas frederiksbergensis]
MANGKYRSDIDGLRAVAVIAVLLHHINTSLVPGGFVGVDIFFVISGFLITSQVFSEVKRGAFSLKGFYQRRINRIVPALVTVLLTTVIVGVFVLSPVDLIRLNVSALLSLLGVSNVYIWMKYGNYFAADAHEAPLLHTWSLGIEEQFYLLWPLFIVLIYRLAPRYVLPIVGVGVVVAIGVSQYATGVFATAAYYLLPTRFFELMLGGLLGIYLYQPRIIGKLTAHGIALAGLLLIGFSLFGLNPDSTFPGVNALIPCLGAALLILAGSGDTRSRLLTSRPMVFIGLISYSLYLWHWPLIAYLNYLEIPIDLPVGAMLIVVSITLAWLSWRYVEVPFRRNGARLHFPRVFTRRFAVPALGLATLAVLSLHFNGFPQRFSPDVSVLEAMTLQKPSEIRKGCHVTNALYGTEPNDACRLGVKKAELDGIMIGDSFANHFTGMVDLLAKPNNLSIMDYTMDSCPPIIGYTVDMSAVYAAHCAKRNERAFSLIEKNHYRYVVLAAIWPRDAIAHDMVEASIKRAVENSGEVIVILRNQHIDKAASCPIRHLMFGTEHSCSVAQSALAPYWADIRVEFPQVRFIDPNQVICPAGVCSPIINGQLLYLDDSHLNEVGSRFIGRTLLDRGYSLLHDPATSPTTAGATFDASAHL